MVNTFGDTGVIDAIEERGWYDVFVRDEFYLEILVVREFYANCTIKCDVVRGLRTWL